MFWKDVLEAWLFYRINVSDNENNDLPHTCIWSSKYIKNCNLLSRKREFIKKGCVYLKDLYNYDTKTWYQKESLKEKYNIELTYFDHMCLLQSIPQTEKRKISEFVDTGQRTFGYIIDSICTQTKCGRYVYKKINW